nr:hypothetical protein B0A51_02886 [Rachicladosporium sp. CCFEE 5018]OQO29860.1 hypothetical protein B0A51_02312 [Rachicladosporium sp. CCFEE 5018]
MATGLPSPPPWTGARKQNYYLTPLIAEPINAVTNLLFIYLAYRGIANSLRYNHDRIFLITFIGYLIVGSGSFAFHATLKYPMQLVDELSMIYTTCLMTWASFAHKRSGGVQVALGVGMASLAIFITGCYHYLQDPTFHQNAYTLLTITVLTRSIWVMEGNLRPYWRGIDNKLSTVEQERVDKRGRAILGKMWWMIVFGVTCFLGAFAIWSLDNEQCGWLRKTRHEIGMPWGFFLEGHGIWHLGTGIGAFHYITWGVWLRRCLDGQQEEYDVIWPHLLSVPECVRRTSLNGTANGHAKPANGHVKAS